MSWLDAKHDTFYFGGEILNTINSVIGHKPDMDRNSTYVWVCDNGFIVFCDMKECDNKGSLEVHKNGSFVSEISVDGIIKYDSAKDDFVFKKDDVVYFLKMYVKH